MTLVVIHWRSSFGKFSVVVFILGLGIRLGNDLGLVLGLGLGFRLGI